MPNISKVISLLTVSCFLLCSATNAQDYGLSHMKPKKLRRWSVGIMASPDWEGRFFAGEKHNSFDGNGPGTDQTQNQQLAHLLAGNEHAGFSFTSGIHFLYDINKRWFARLGFYYSDKKIYSDDFIVGIYGRNGFSRIASPNFSSSFPFLEIPLTFHYILNKPFDKSKDGTCYTSYTQYNRKKPLFYVFAGPAYSVNLNKHYFITRTFSAINDPDFASSTPVYVDGFKLNHFGIYLGAGVMKYFNKHLFLTAEPTFRFFPVRWYPKKFKQDETDVDPNPKAVTYHVIDMPWSVGLQVALNYHF